MSEWDRLEAEDRSNNIYPFPGEPPAYMDDLPPYADEKPDVDEPLVLIDPSSWSGIEPPVRRWKVKDHIPDGKATLLTGKGAAGKSLVSQLMCACIAMGLPFLGLHVEQGNTLYVTCEDENDELQRRQGSICDGLGVALADLSGKMFLLSLEGELDNNLANFSVDGRMTIAALYRRILSTCLRYSITTVVLDNTAHLFTGNENDRNQVASFINLCNRMAKAIGGAVVIVGHPNKAGDSYSGSTAWENQVRSRLFMEIPSDENGNVADPDMRVMRREKVNYAQRGGELSFMWFKGTFVLPGDAVAATSSELGQTIADTRDNDIFLVCLKERNRQQRAVSEQKASRTYAPKEMAAMPESKAIGRARLERAMDRLFRIGAIERGFLWVYRGESKPCHGLRIVEGKYGAPTTSKISDDLSDDVPMTSSMTYPMTSGDGADESGDTHPLDTTYQGRGPHEAAPLPEEENRESDFGEPPAWMDDAPPIDPRQSLFDAADDQSGGDWHDNPILNKGPKP